MARNAILLLLAGAAIAQGSILRSAAPKEEAPKEEGKGTPALAGKMPLKAQEQGFSGEHVKHADQKTSTADWGDEYGSEKEQALHEKVFGRSGSWGLKAAVWQLTL